jgi:hypothetical protein
MSNVPYDEKRSCEDLKETGSSKRPIVYVDASEDRVKRLQTLGTLQISYHGAGMGLLSNATSGLTHLIAYPRVFETTIFFPCIERPLVRTVTRHGESRRCQDVDICNGSEKVRRTTCCVNKSLIKYRKKCTLNGRGAYEE